MDTMARATISAWLARFAFDRVMGGGVLYEGDDSFLEDFGQEVMHETRNQRNRRES
jgi:hypothetical protein